jgi:DNA topoisomerase-1
MRTDSFRISAEALRGAQYHIQSNFGPDFYPEKPNVYRSKKKVQDAHEAIRPTLPFHTPMSLKGVLSEAQMKVYRLIWDRFFASQMKEATIAETTFEIANGEYLFISKGEIVVFPGFLKQIKAEEGFEPLPDLEENETLRLHRLIPEQNFTKPPARYTEASLVKVLEEKGIGRPSTYAKIIDTLGRREYIYREERKFVPTVLGIRVVEYLVENFKDIMNYNFTAELEKQLDLVSEGELDWVRGIEQFYSRLDADLSKVKQTDKVDLLVGRSCPRCNSPLVNKYSHKTNGWFVGCSGYPECRYTEKFDGQNNQVADVILDETCPECNKPLVKRYSRKTRKYFIGCTGYPQCKYILAEDKQLGDCPRCGKALKKRFSRKTRRYFVGCSGYPDCTYIQRK